MEIVIQCIVSLLQGISLYDDTTKWKVWPQSITENKAQKTPFYTLLQLSL